MPIAPIYLAAGLLAVSLLDDRSNLPVAWRLAAHAASAICLVLVWRASTANSATPPVETFSWLATWWGAGLTIIAICWSTNLFNFMDGADGLAGGMTLIGFGAYAIASSSSSTVGTDLATLTTAISGAALGFLLFNLPPAKVFMGDAGAVPIGFLAAALGVEGYLRGVWPLGFGVLVFSPFIVDATVTLLRRLARGEKIWMAHREHYYQRLILSGFSHRQTVFSYYVLMLGSALSALIAQKHSLLYPIASFWVITYLSLLMYLEWRFYQQKKHKTEKNSEAK
ncbi:MAG: glycosyltransferase family 4 protein [Betaproteobacteria bacterium]